MSILRSAGKWLIYGAIEFSGWSRRNRHRLRGDLIILTYHSFTTKWLYGLFNSLPVYRFEQQLRFLKQHFHIVSLEQGVENIQAGCVSDKPFLAITIDDGFRDNYTLAWPLLKHYEVPATIFLTTDFLDTGRSPWPTQLVEMFERTERQTMEFQFRSELRTRKEKSLAVHRLKRAWSILPPQERFSKLAALREYLGVKDDTRYPPLTWTQVREMQKEGISFGSHTVYHSIFPAVDDDVVEMELRDSKQRIESELQEPCNLFAYPDGKHSATACRLVETLDFKVALTQDRGSNSKESNLFAMKRIEIPFNETLSTFICRSSLMTL
jgi:peptidoglycan/xylan/chitin deacetylase (PgdA/CDA1 family)